MMMSHSKTKELIPEQETIPAKGIISLDVSTSNVGIVYIDKENIYVELISRESNSTLMEYAFNILDYYLDSLDVSYSNMIVFVEDVILGLNARSSIKQARFIGMLEGVFVGEAFGLNDWIFVNPSSVKKCFTGKGNANKEMMIDQMLQIKGIKKILSRNSGINIKEQLIRHKEGKITSLEHIADAFGVLSAGVTNNMGLIPVEILEMMKRHNIPFM